MKAYSVGFAKKNAEQFFGMLRRTGIRRVVDIRLRNTSQLAGFTKREDLPYFLRELCGAEYRHEPLLAPTDAILDGYKKAGEDWATYERAFLPLLQERHIERHLPRDLFEVPTALLCAEPTAEHCHRRLILEYLAKKWGGLEIVHL